MMGIKEDSERPEKVEKPSERKKYIVVKNHVREIPNVKAIEQLNESDKETNKEIQKVKKNKKKGVTSSDSEVSASGISENDLEELRTVYNRCKAVLRKMETKYGHLLQIDVEEGSSNRKRRLSSVECQCISKRKILYDDEGRQVYQNINADHHICPANIQKLHNNTPHIPETLSIENEMAYELPDDVHELTEILKESKVTNYIKYQVIQKIKNIRQENGNILRFEKQNLIEKLKLEPDNILEFMGSNLSSLPGYPVNPA